MPIFGHDVVYLELTTEEHIDLCAYSSGTATTMQLWGNGDIKYVGSLINSVTGTIP